MSSISVIFLSLLSGHQAQIEPVDTTDKKCPHADTVQQANYSRSLIKHNAIVGYLGAIIAVISPLTGQTAQFKDFLYLKHSHNG